MKSPKNKKKAPQPGHAGAKAFLDAKAQIAELQALLLQLMEGQGSTADEAKVDSSLKSISQLLGFAQEGHAVDSEQFQRGLLQAFKNISQVSKNALQVSKLPPHPDTEQLFSLIKDFEADLARQDAELTRVAREAATRDAKDHPATDHADQAAHLDSLQAGMEKILADNSSSLEKIFEGMEQVMAQFADRLGIPKPKETDIVAEVSAKVSKELGEANKKNMIGEDFDWSSIYRKS